MRLLAYFLWLSRRDEAPDPMRDWLEAEQRLRATPPLPTGVVQDDDAVFAARKTRDVRGGR